jgi:hypothetical protein
VWEWGDVWQREASDSIVPPTARTGLADSGGGLGRSRAIAQHCSSVVREITLGERFHPARNAGAAGSRGHHPRVTGEDRSSALPEKRVTSLDLVTSHFDSAHAQFPFLCSLSHQNVWHCTGSRTATTPRHDGRPRSREVARGELTPPVGSRVQLACDDYMAHYLSNEPGRTARGRIVIVQNADLASDTPIKHSPALGAPPIMGIFKLDPDRATAWRCTTRKSYLLVVAKGRPSQKVADRLSVTDGESGRCCRRGLCRRVVSTEGLLCADHPSPTLNAEPRDLQHGRHRHGPIRAECPANVRLE